MKDLPVQIAPGRTLSRAPQPETLDELRAIAKAYVKAPSFKSWHNEDDAFMALMYGMDCGLTCTQSLTYVMVVNGRASLWGEAVMGLCIATGSFCHATHREWIDQSDPENPVAHCVVKRLPNGSPQESTFSWQQVKKAGLDVKKNRENRNVSLYQTYGPDMLAARARSRALKKTWPDVLAGMAIVEEQQDAVASRVSNGQPVALLDNSEQEAMLPKAKPAPPTPTLMDMTDPSQHKFQADEPTRHVKGKTAAETFSVADDKTIPAEDAQSELDGAAAAIVEEAPEDRERRGTTTKAAQRELDTQRELLDRGGPNAAAE